MEIIQPSATLMALPDLLFPDSWINRIELIGRTAYKSESKITSSSGVEFVKKIIKSGHESVLEHMTHILEVEGSDEALLGDFAEIQDSTIGFHWSMQYTGAVVSFNVRTLRDMKRNVENDLTDSVFKHLVQQYPLLYGDLEPSVSSESYYKVTDMTEEVMLDNLPINQCWEHIYRSVRFICDRGVTHEIVRHRPPSYTQESTRYCNYAKKGITFIKPPWGFNNEDMEFLFAVEAQYNKKIAEGWSPQEARGFLPNCLKTEIIMTANLTEWWHFFELRTAESAHPQMRQLTIPLFEDFKRTIGHNFGVGINTPLT